MNLLWIHLLLALTLWVLLRLSATRKAPARRRFPRSIAPTAHRFHPPKPPWVREEVLRLKAMMMCNGCRKIALTFNHMYEQHRFMTVSKSYVANVLRQSQEEVLRRRKELKHRQPRRVAINDTWGIDLTYCQGDLAAPILGVIDHGSRKCLDLEQLKTKTSVELIRALLKVVEQCGRPKIVRTDNEPCFTSWLFRFALALLGIRHQRTAPHAPWQNGRIERFFGTFKRALRQRREVCGQQAVGQADLDLFRGWYNHLRFHQHLDGRTPAEAWAGKEATRRGKARYFSEWGGALAGFYWRE